MEVENACLSRAVLQHLGISPLGMRRFYWPCRMEKFSYSGFTVVLDGCHNGDSVRKFLSSLRAKYGDSHRIVAVFGAGLEKSVGDMLEHLWVYPDALLMVQSKHFRSMTEQELLDRVPEDQRSKLLPTQRNQPREQCCRSPQGTIHRRLQELLSEHPTYVRLLTVLSNQWMQEEEDLGCCLRLAVRCSGGEGVSVQVSTAFPAPAVDPSVSRLTSFHRKTGSPRPMT